MAQVQFRSDDTTQWSERFGDGSDGDLVISSSASQNNSRAGCSGSSGANTLTVGSAVFSNNDLIFIYQTRGTGAGTWMLNKVLSGGGTTSLGLKYSLVGTFTDSAHDSAQAILIKEYSSITVNSGVTWSAPSWDGETGGVLIGMSKGDITIAGTVSANGGNASGNTAGTGGGFRGGRGGVNGIGNNQAEQAEGSAGAGQVISASANGNGGAGGNGTSNGGGGGGHANAGSNSNGGIVGGSAVGNAALTTIFLGGGGGGGGTSNNGGDQAGGGGAGAGIIILIGKTITFTGAGTLNGGNGADRTVGQGSGGGGGAGGAMLLKGQVIVLGSNLISANNGSGINNGANGSVGRIHADYSKSISGTTSPTIDTRQDSVFTDAPGFFPHF